MLQVAGHVAGHQKPISGRSGLTPVRLVLPAKGRTDLVMPFAEDANGGEPRDEVLPTELNLLCAIHLQGEHMLRCLTANKNTLLTPWRPALQGAWLRWWH